MVAHWREQSFVPGFFYIWYSIGRALVGDRTGKSRLTASSITESQFADDASLYTSSCSNLNTMACKFVAAAERWGLPTSIRKTKGMAMGPGSVDDPVDIGNGDNVV